MKHFLFPFSYLYQLITDFRNYAYSKGWFREIRFDIFTINIGNLSVGGTGKTPMVEYLIVLLKNKHRIATLSRGYGRKTKGFRLANDQDTAQTLGDEPLQFYQKFGKDIAVCVGEERILAVPELLALQPYRDILLLDDAYQHRSIGRHLNILLTNYQQPFFEDHVLPMGFLREQRMGAKRADVVVVSKCPDNLNQEGQARILAAIKHYTEAQTPIFFTAIRYQPAVSFRGNIQLNTHTKVVVVCGIAKPEPFIGYCEQNFDIVGKHIFADHYRYTTKDMVNIATELQQKQAVLLCTEKDMVKLATLTTNMPTAYYIPIGLSFLNNAENTFNSFIMGAIEKKYNSSI
jgi:tetraacyldisaccharide 4'-kinase